MSGKVKVWGNVVTVEWADPIEDPDPEVMAKVRTRSSAKPLGVLTFSVPAEILFPHSLQITLF